MKLILPVLFVLILPICCKAFDSVPVVRPRLDSLPHDLYGKIACYFCHLNNLKDLYYLSLVNKQFNRGARRYLLQILKSKGKWNINYLLTKAIQKENIILVQHFKKNNLIDPVFLNNLAYEAIKVESIKIIEFLREIDEDCFFQYNSPESPIMEIADNFSMLQYFYLNFNKEKLLKAKESGATIAHLAVWSTSNTQKSAILIFLAMNLPEIFEARYNGLTPLDIIWDCSTNGYCYHEPYRKVMRSLFHQIKEILSRSRPEGNYESIDHIDVITEKNSWCIIN